MKRNLSKGKLVYHFKDYNLIEDHIQVHIPGEVFAERVQKGHNALQAAIPNGVYWTPGRMYQYTSATAGSVGSWPENQFPVGTFITGTLFGQV